jgi:hypothetical protein
MIKLLKNIVLPPWAGITLKILPWALLAPCFLLGQCSGARNERAKLELSVEKASTKALQNNATANDAASASRVEDAVRNATNKKELYDEIAKVPDSVPGPARVALGCKRLREHRGSKGTPLPAVCGPKGAH